MQTSTNGMKFTTLHESVIGALRAAQITDSRVYLPKLDSKIYKKVNNALIELDGEWNTQAQAHIFPEDAGFFLNPVLESGKMIFARRQDYFPTPPEVIETMLCWTEIKTGNSILEPSAADGAICDEIRDWIGLKHVQLDMVEFNPKLVARLKRKGYTAENNCRVFCENFLTYKPDKLYDRIVMNPPFGKTADIDHVLHAFGMLRRGGVLTAIMSQGTLWHQDAKTVNFRRYIEPYEHITVEFTNKEFRASGTDVDTCMITLIK